MLSRDLARYVEQRRSLGFKCHSEHILLRGFVAFAERCGDTHVKSTRVLAWVGNLGYHLLHRDLLEEAAEAVFEAYFGQGGGARPVREGRACIFLRLLGLGLLWG